VSPLRIDFFFFLLISGRAWLISRHGLSGLGVVGVLGWRRFDLMALGGWKRQDRSEICPDQCRQLAADGSANKTCMRCVSQGGPVVGRQ
jgi:hypothetical protein